MQEGAPQPLTHFKNVEKAKNRSSFYKISCHDMTTVTDCTKTKIAHTKKANHDSIIFDKSKQKEVLLTDAACFYDIWIVENSH